jgi:hypothetical protein
MILTTTLSSSLISAASLISAVIAMALAFFGSGPDKPLYLDCCAGAFFGSGSGS